MSSRDYFKGKRIAVIGLGPLGEMVADIKFLIRSGALVALYDLRSEDRLKSHLVLLRALGLASHVCGSVPSDDLLDMDMIILSHEYPRDSSFLHLAKEKKVAIEYPETLFFKLAPPITLVGIMGSCGKATVISMLSPMLETVCRDHEGQGFFVVDPEDSSGIIAHLKKIKTGDIVLLRIVEAIMKELYDMRVSPQVAVFTTVPPRGAYRQSPFEILSYKTYKNFVVASDEVVEATHSLSFQPKGKMLRTKHTLIPPDWELNGRGSHDRDNAALALQTARLFKITDEVARPILESWKSLRGRLELVKKVKNVEFYNDTASVSGEATLAGMVSLSENRNVVLIFGGAEAGCDYKYLYRDMPKYARVVITVPGSGTIRERHAMNKIDHVEVYAAPDIEEAARLALEHSRKGDRVLFSPGFEAGGLDCSRKERGERFVRAVRAL